MELQEIFAKAEDFAVVVEGKNDKSALQKFGVKNIFTIDRPIYKLCEDIAKLHDKAIILTDLDKEGKKLYSKIKHGLTKNRVKVDDRLREFLYKETNLAQIEGLYNYFQKNEGWNIK